MASCCWRGWGDGELVGGEDLRLVGEKVLVVFWSVEVMWVYNVDGAIGLNQKRIGRGGLLWN